MSGEAQPAYEKSVFINCPFDPDFRDLLLAIVFTVAAHGFVARSARETEGTAEPRISRILQTLAGSKYSIHDLSRFSGEGTDNLGRFNMPLELGMAAALRFERMGTARPHNWLVLVPDGYLHQRFISDLAGIDPGKHTSAPPSVIREASAWLRLQPDVSSPAPSALQIHTAFGTFCNYAGSLRTAALEKESWADLLLAARRTVPGA
jgi:hypothetical protein